MKKTLLGFISILASFVCTGQNQPVFSQFTLNPFQFNPSYAAYNGYAETNVFFRKQWMNIENAPTVGAFNIQAPVGRNVSLGLTVVSNQTILLNTTSALATFAYRVRFSTNHHFNFGLSAGIASNNFNAEAVANDPVFANAELRNMYATGQFGINYRNRNLNIGFALPSLFDARPISTTEFQAANLDPFRNKFGSASYNFNFDRFQLSPIIIYRALDNQLQQTQWELMVMATYKNSLWIGVSYREGYGLTGIVGLRLGGNFRVSYSYEYPSSWGAGSAPLGSHEFYLGARLGKHDREEQFAQQYEHKKDSVAQATNTEFEPQEEIQNEEETAPEKTEPAEVQPVPVEDNVKTELAEEKEEEEVVVEPQTVTTYYVVAGSYRNRQNAIGQMRILHDLGMIPVLVYNPERQYFYVCIVKTDNREEALEVLSKERDRNRFQGVWIYREEKK